METWWMTKGLFIYCPSSHPDYSRHFTEYKHSPIHIHTLVAGTTFAGCHLLIPKDDHSHTLLCDKASGTVQGSVSCKCKLKLCNGITQIVHLTLLPSLIRPSVKSSSSRSAMAGTTSATLSWPYRETVRLSGTRTRTQAVLPLPPTLWLFSNWWWAAAGGCKRRCWPSWLQQRVDTEGWVWMCGSKSNN